jgi:hypothetical protein
MEDSFHIKSLTALKLPDSTYFIMGVWPIKNPGKAIGAVAAVW